MPSDILTVAREALRTLDLKPEGFMVESGRVRRLAQAVIDLSAALQRLIPIARDAKHEDFSTIDGKEDTRTAAILNAIAALKGCVEEK